MPRSLPRTFADVYAAVSEELKRKLGDAQASALGPPPSVEVEPANDDAYRQAWQARDPQVTDEALLALGQQKYQEHLAKGLDPEKARRALAEDLTHAMYPYRARLYTHGQVDWKAQAKEAGRLKRLADRGGGDDD